MLIIENHIEINGKDRKVEDLTLEEKKYIGEKLNERSLEAIGFRKVDKNEERKSKKCRDF
ncbi:MAG: hypothetical protein K2M46_02835 [Lachnospiraceae bacterium]|nr:hypothetical protein [Lachnospiraceae bacterium]